MKMKLLLICVLAALLSAGCAARQWITPAQQPTAPGGLSVAEITLTAMFAPGGPFAPSDTPIPTDTLTAPPPTYTPPPPTATLTAVPPTDTAVPPTATKTKKPTRTPTKKPALTRTATSVPQREGPLVKAAYFTPKLDGVWDEWTNKAYPAKSVTYGKKNWSGADDLEASFRVGWDADYLYIAAKVIDDTYAQNASGKDLYKGDSLELLIDTNLYGDFRSSELSDDDYQLGISPGKPDVVEGKREAYLWYPSSVAGGRSLVKIAAVKGKDEDGRPIYRVEAAVPWSLLGVTPKAGARYGFAFSVSDNDNTSENVQQSLVSNDAYRVLTDPTTWGELVLVK